MDREADKEEAGPVQGRRSVRDQILRAAMDLFAKGGSRGTPLAAIAERVGVTTPAITHHFGTKEALLMEVVEHNDRLTQSRIRLPDGGTGMESLASNRQWARLLTGNSDVRNLGRLSTVMTAEALDVDFPGHEHFRDRQREFHRLMFDLVRTGQRDGSIRHDADPKLVAAQVIAFMQGAQLQWLLDPEEVPIEKIFDDYFDRLRTDLAPRPARSKSKRAATSKRTERRRTA